MEDELVILENDTVGFYSNMKLTLNDAKNIIKEKINVTCSSYVAIGYYLKYISDRGLFKQEGYSGVGEFAEAEFGIKEAKTSKLIRIVEKLCVGGNSPVLKDEWKDFSIAKLEEIIYLDESQLSKVDPVMTKAEIRNIKKVDKEELSPAKELDNTIQQMTVVSEDIKTQNKELIVTELEMVHYSVPDRNTLGKIVDIIKTLTEEEVVNTIPKFFTMKKEDSNFAGKWRFENFSGFVYQINGSDDWKTVSWTKYVSLIKEGFKNHFADKDDVVAEPVTVNDYQESVIKMAEIVNQDSENVTETEEIVIESVETEVIEAEVIHSELDHCNEPMVKKMARFAMEWFDNGDYGSADFYLFQARKELADNYEYERVSYPDYYNDNRKLQLPLPTLKNNDQRKEWIDSYNSWPVWIDLPHTGEKFYRYDLTNKIAITVKVSKKHGWENYKESKELEYGAEQYFLLGVKSEWSQKGAKYTIDDTRTFYECNTNKSTLVDYLKEFQKGEKYGKESTK